jgi:glycine/D-amino acid oxidase-like deaminating enzyme
LTGEVFGSLFIPFHGYVDAGQLVQALAAAARHHGATFAVPRRVQRVSSTGAGLTVHTDAGPLRAGTVILAAGSWTGQVEVQPVAGLPIRPVRGQLLRLGWQGPLIRTVVWGERCYLVPWDDGTLLVGATVEEAGFDERTTVAGVRELMEAACDLVPNARTASFLEARVGFRPASPDLLPVIGRSAALPNLVYATGHYRSGVLLSPITAALVADLVLDGRRDPLLDAMAPQRFPEVESTHAVPADPS